jgi:CheY-like chemotaxis protein
LIDGDGLTISRHIREADPRIPIVFITGDPELTIEEVLSAGGNLLIDKGSPRFIDELIDAAERLLDGKPSLVTN